MLPLDGGEENPVAGSNFQVKVCLPRRVCTHLEGIGILSFILSFGVIFIEDVSGLVLFYVERSENYSDIICVDLGY